MSLGLVALVCLASTVRLLVPEVVPNPGGDSHACPDEDVTEPWNHRMSGIGRVEIIKSKPFAKRGLPRPGCTQLSLG